MDIEFTKHAWEEFEYWVENDPSKVDKIKDLLKSIKQSPFKGLGKPEALKHDLKGFWSRRISGEHRLVYRISGKKSIDQRCSIIQCRYHYDDE
ncbi:MAG: Txe/YoeB family addiction module toxin [Saprospiraceae bacterium]|nr:Txe/YoeB family addiction module toxin [Saprospiraceae bacterium]